MDDRGTAEGRLVAQGVEVELDRSLQIGALRYCDAAEPGPILRALFGAALPPPLRWVAGAMPSGRGECLLIWRSPTETWLLTTDEEPLAALRRDLADAPTACLVEQTGGILALRVTGQRARDLLQRIGSGGAFPQPGETRTCRIADVAVTVVCSQPHEHLLLIDRAYREHLLGWIGATLSDF